MFKGTQNTDNGDDLQYKYTTCLIKTHAQTAWKVALAVPLLAQTFVFSLSPSFPFVPSVSRQADSDIGLLRAGQQAE